MSGTQLRKLFQTASADVPG